MTSSDLLKKRDLDALMHPATNYVAHNAKGPLIMDSARGVFITDVSGKQYIEGMAGLWCTALGYGVEELVETAREQMAKLSYGHMFASRSHEPGIELAAKLKSLAPIEDARVFFGNSGSDANDTQVKMIWYYNNCIGRPEKKKIIARSGGYHGVTIASASMTGLPVNHADFDLPIDRFLHTTKPHFYREGRPGEDEAAFTERLVRDLEALIEREGADTIAAFIAEPVIGAGGVILPPEGYFQKIQEVLDRYDILLIDDEVVCGFHRTNNLFGAQTYNMKPATMTLAKALSSAYLPISATIISGDMYEPMVERSQENNAFGHGYTYSGHPVAAALSLKNIELMERWNIADHVAQISPIFEGRFARLGDHPLVGEVRAVGMIGAVELVKNQTDRSRFDKVGPVGLKCFEAALDEGLIVRNIGDSIALCPPLVITESELNETFDRLERALDRTADWAHKEGFLAA
ncbi:MAG: aminotransferase [Alphaproteobacteria bacterium]|nr:aminotransferase [Alphaproteobacteria bacterium]